MGWTVIDIKRLNDGNVYSTSEYNSLLHRKRNIHELVVKFDKYNLLKIIEIILLLILFYKMCK